MVADQQKGGTQLIAQPSKEGGQFHNARRIERGERFVGDDEGGAARQRLRDGDTLALAAGEFVGIGSEDARGMRQSGEREEFRRVACPAVRAQDFGDLDADAQHRVQGLLRVLEDHGDLAAADGLQLGFGGGEEVAAAHQDLSAHAILGGREQFEDGEGEGGLAAARIARQPYDGCRRDREGDAAQKMAVWKEVDREIADFEQRPGRHSSYSIAKLSLFGAEIDPFDAARPVVSFAGNARDQVDDGMARAIVADGGVGEADIEALHVERRRDSFAKLRQSVPDHALFLDVQIVKRSHVAAGRHQDVTRG